MFSFLAVSMFYWIIANLVYLKIPDVEDHMKKEHSLGSSSQESDVDWLEIAQKEKIHLECPFCSNTFQKEGYR